MFGQARKRLWNSLLFFELTSLWLVYSEQQSHFFAGLSTEYSWCFNFNYLVIKIIYVTFVFTRYCHYFFRWNWYPEYGFNFNDFILINVALNSKIFS